MSQNVVSLSVPIRPMVYFADYAEGIRVSRNAKRTSVMLPQFLLDWLSYSQRNLPQGLSHSSGPHTEEHVASLALQYGVTRPARDWGYSTDQFEELTERGLRESAMNGGPRWKYWPRWETDHERETEKKVNLRIEPEKRKILEVYKGFLGLDKQSPLIRHFLALAFRWYSGGVYANNVMCGWNEETQAYVVKLREGLDNQMEKAAEMGYLLD